MSLLFLYQGQIPFPKLLVDILQGDYQVGEVASLYEIQLFLGNRNAASHLPKYFEGIKRARVTQNRGFRLLLIKQQI